MKNCGFIPRKEWRKMNYLADELSTNMQHKNLIFYRDLYGIQLMV